MTFKLHVHPVSMPHSLPNADESEEGGIQVVGHVSGRAGRGVSQAGRGWFEGRVQAACRHVRGESQAGHGSPSYEGEIF